MKLFYLASPFSSNNKQVEAYRFKAVTYILSKLHQEKRFVYSPITHNYPMIEKGLMKAHEEWMQFDLAMLSKCDGLLVLKLEGFENSRGVTQEIAFAEKNGIPIEWIDQPAKDEVDNFSEKTLQDLLYRLKEMFREREWKKFHSPKNIAMNLGVEVGELMEPFRWLTTEQSYFLDEETKKEVEGEIADCFNMLLYLSDLLGIDPVKSSFKKINIIEQRYPVEECRGKCDKYTKYQVLSK